VRRQGERQDAQNGTKTYNRQDAKDAENGTRTYNRQDAKDAKNGMKKDRPSGGQEIEQD